jgi:hypothetical protein
MTSAVLSVQPSPTTSNSKFVSVCARIERIANGKTSARLCVGTSTVMCGGVLPSTTLDMLEAKGDTVIVQRHANLIGVGVVIGAFIVQHHFLRRDSLGIFDRLVVSRHGTRLKEYA